MKVIKNPPREIWGEIIQRPSVDTEKLEAAVKNILAAVRDNGDDALFNYTMDFDGVSLDTLEVIDDEFEEADSLVPPKLKEAIAAAKSNIEKFHAVRPEEPEVVETTPGVFCWRKLVPIESVGLYVPAGTAPLFSTVLMLAIPAKLAGCREVILCSPPDKKGKINAVSLYTAKLCGVTRVLKIGGAQAIAAMGYGTKSVPKVHKIFGPGNQFVTQAKQQISEAGAAIDMPAGPSELAILADASSIPAFVASDLLSQAEHGPDSQVLLVATEEKVINETLAEVARQIGTLPRREFAAAALETSKAVVVDSIATGIGLINEYAPEHLIIATNDADQVANQVINAGSVFIGNFSCESAGDYASGTNHTLPTNGFARAYSGVSVESFTKKITFQKLTAKGIQNLGPMIEQMAGAEGLLAHKRAVSIRLEMIGGEDDI
ncbi:MAG: histidinol dehydrogenase [Pyrinomonadaceae bacterium]